MTKRSLLISLIVISGLSCSPKTNVDQAAIETLRERIEHFVKAQLLVGYRSWVFGEASSADSLYQANSDLFSAENIRLLQRAESVEHDSTQRKRLWYLRRFLISEYLGKETAILTDRTSNIEATSTINVDGNPIAYRNLSGAISNESSQANRKKLYDAATLIVDTLNKYLVRVEEINQRVSRELGFASYDEMAELMKGFSLEAFRATARTIIENTDSIYAHLLNRDILKPLKLTDTSFYRFDTGLLSRGAQFDRFFPDAKMMQTLVATYGGMGIDIPKLNSLSIDSEKRERKSPRAVCFSIDVPNDIRLSIKPIGGMDDYGALFHEVGHGMHYVHTTENAIEFKYLGEQTVTEVYAFLSEYLLVNQAWLRMKAGLTTSQIKDFVRYQAFQRLFMIRLYAGMFLYESELHSGAANPEKLYTQLVVKTIGCVPYQPDEKRYLTSVDPLYYSASYLRAWFLEAQLNAELTARFGVNWFENREAGDFLISLWKLGDRLNGDELARHIGVGAISPDKLLEQIRMMIVFSSKPSM